MLPESMPRKENGSRLQLPNRIDALHFLRIRSCPSLVRIDLNRLHRLHRLYRLHRLRRLHRLHCFHSRLHLARSRHRFLVKGALQSCC